MLIQVLASVHAHMEVRGHVGWVSSSISFHLSF